MKRFLLTITALLVCAFGVGAQTYYSPNGGMYSGAGTNCPGKNTTQIPSGGITISSPGTYYICGGTYTGLNGGSLITITSRANGSSGSPTQIIGDTGATVVLRAGYFGTNGAIHGSRLSYVTLNGNNVVTIQNTANGTALANQQNSYGILCATCSNTIIENFTVVLHGAVKH